MIYWSDECILPEEFNKDLQLQIQTVYLMLFTYLAINWSLPQGAYWFGHWIVVWTHGGHTSKQWGNVGQNDKQWSWYINCLNTEIFKTYYRTPSWEHLNLHNYLGCNCFHLLHWTGTSIAGKGFYLPLIFLALLILQLDTTLPIPWQIRCFCVGCRLCWGWEELWARNKSHCVQLDCFFSCWAPCKLKGKGNTWGSTWVPQL